MLNRSIVAALLSFLAAVLPALAQYPNKSVRIVVPYPPGGGTDILARIVAQKLTDRWEQTAIVDNRGGATGMIGTEIITRALPDAYSVLLSASQEIVINPNIYKKLRYDPLKDLVGVTLVARTPNIFVVHPSVPVSNFNQFIELAKQRPGQMSYASTGIGSSQHMAGAVLVMEAKINLVNIPYKGGGPQVVDLIAGQTPAGFVALPAAIQYVRQGRLKGLGVTSSKRSAALPDIPTMIEAGLPGVDVDQWYAVFVPANTPSNLVRKLNTDFVWAINLPDVRSRLLDLGYEPEGNSPEQLAKFVRDQLERYRKIVRDAAIPIE